MEVAGGGFLSGDPRPENIIEFVPFFSLAYTARLPRKSAPFRPFCQEKKQKPIGNFHWRIAKTVNSGLDFASDNAVA
jgi:hypothetical protein